MSKCKDCGMWFDDGSVVPNHDCTNKDVESERPNQDEAGPSIGDGQQPDNLAGVRQIADLEDAAIRIYSSLLDMAIEEPLRTFTRSEEFKNAMISAKALYLDMASVRRSVTQDA